MEKLYIEKVNNTYLRITTEDDIRLELAEQFKFKIPNWKFHPLVKQRRWNGDINLFNKTNNTIYVGLLGDIIKFCDDRGYQAILTKEVKECFDDPLVTKESFAEWIKSFPIQAHGEETFYRDYQLLAIYRAIKKKRQVIISPTGSGKSLIIYGILRHFINIVPDRILIVVPTTSLVEQLYSDFKDYSGIDDEWEVSDYCSKLYAAYDRDDSSQVMISTWQSLQKLDSHFFHQFSAVIIDETHGAKSDQVRKILESSINADYKIGLTGTLDGQETNEMVIKGLLGNVFQVQTSKQLMDDGTLAELDITAIQLNYPKIKLPGKTYQDEVKFLKEFRPRTKYIADLALNLNGNTLILFNHKDHGQEILSALGDSKQIYFIDGSIDALEREDIRHLLENSNNCILVASYGTTSTGVNIRNIHNVIFASPSKSVIRVLQSIGRGLRKTHNKSECRLFDIVDNINSKNFAYKHFLERLRIYTVQQFKYKFVEVNLK